MTNIIDRARELLTCDELRGRVPEEVRAFLRDVVALGPVAGTMILGPNTEAEWTEYGHSLPPGTKLYTAPPAKASEPAYDRSLIADMLEDLASGRRGYLPGSIAEQARLLRAADNADAAKVRTVRASGSAPQGWRAQVERAVARARVFDDGSDGADAESARSVVAILTALLEGRTPPTGEELCARTPPASAQEVTEEMVNRACNAYDKKSTELEGFSSEYPAMHAALTAALQEPRHG